MNETHLALLIPSITFVVEALKRAGLPSKYAPLLSLVIGLIYGTTIAILEKNPLALFDGVLAAGAAVGLYEYGKKGVAGVNLLKAKLFS